jgi:hypothetical protein
LFLVTISNVVEDDDIAEDLKDTFWVHFFYLVRSEVQPNYYHYKFHDLHSSSVFKCVWIWGNLLYLRNCCILDCVPQTSSKRCL